MESEIIVALISLTGVIISAVVSNAVASKTAANKFSEEIAVLKIKLENVNEKLDATDKHIQEHNHYAKLFHENIPVIQEKLKVTEHRLEDLENAQKKY